MSLSLKGGMHWAGEHPVEAGIGVFAIGLAVLWMLGFFKPAASSSGTEANGSSTALDSAYVQATGAQSQAQAATQIASINANASTAQAQIASNTTLGVNNIWSAQQLQTSENANQTQLNLGELSLDQQLNAQGTTNADNQFLLNLNEFGNTNEFETLVNSGYFATH